LSVSIIRRVEGLRKEELATETLGILGGGSEDADRDTIMRYNDAPQIW
jgi:hypothetical protein